MPSQVTNYQCPACTGPLHFVGKSGKLECDYCGSTYEVSEIEALYQKKEEQAAKAMKMHRSKMHRTKRLLPKTHRIKTQKILTAGMSPA